MGYYYKNNIRIVFYTPNNLHSKTILIDGEVFGVGSPNFDYRSFRYQHEIMLFGRHKGIIDQVRAHINETLDACIDFDHTAWMRRPRFEKLLGWLLLPFRHLF
jgi:cardiolipin synthase